MSFNHTPWGDKKKPMCDKGIQQFNMTRPKGGGVGIQEGVYQGCVVDHGLINCTYNKTEQEKIYCGSWFQKAANGYTPKKRPVTNANHNFTGGFLLVQFKIIPEKMLYHQIIHINDWLLWHYTVTDDGLSMDMSSTGHPHNWDCADCKEFTLADVQAQIDFPENPTQRDCNSQHGCSLFEKMKKSKPTPAPTPSAPYSYPTPVTTTRSQHHQRQRPRRERRE
jgi:hypothetical protein